jgi:hypothetical protein
MNICTDCPNSNQGADSVGVFGETARKKYYRRTLKFFNHWVAIVAKSPLRITTTNGLKAAGSARHCPAANGATPSAQNIIPFSSLAGQMQCEIAKAALLSPIWARHSPRQYQLSQSFLFTIVGKTQPAL